MENAYYNSVNKMLLELGCAKINLQIRNDNKEAVKFYHKQGYQDDALVSLGKRLTHD